MDKLWVVYLIEDIYFGFVDGKCCVWLFKEGVVDEELIIDDGYILMVIWI